jgi:hypothetical protein
MWAELLVLHTFLVNPRHDRFVHAAQRSVRAVGPKLKRGRWRATPGGWIERQVLLAVGGVLVGKGNDVGGLACDLVGVVFIWSGARGYRDNWGR